MKKFRINHNEKGFTLIELMIVIAIIGILSAIAIPNFISYRNKSYCSGAETDAGSIAAAVADYFSIPTHTGLSDPENTLGVAEFLSNNNTWDVDADDIDAIEIVVTDISGRCPTDYMDALAKGTSPKGYWITANSEYVKILSN